MDLSIPFLAFTTYTISLTSFETFLLFFYFPFGIVCSIIFAYVYYNALSTIKDIDKELYNTGLFILLILSLALIVAWFVLIPILLYYLLNIYFFEEEEKTKKKKQKKKKQKKKKQRG